MPKREKSSKRDGQARPPRRSARRRQGVARRSALPVRDDGPPSQSARSSRRARSTSTTRRRKSCSSSSSPRCSTPGSRTWTRAWSASSTRSHAERAHLALRVVAPTTRALGEGSSPSSRLSRSGLGPEKRRARPQASLVVETHYDWRAARSKVPRTRVRRPGSALLMHVWALIVGMHQLSEPSPTSFGALSANSGLRELEFDFFTWSSVSFFSICSTACIVRKRRLERATLASRAPKRSQPVADLPRCFPRRRCRCRVRVARA